jgi:NAD(P)-dependent dehydrogenase (short-subunit alcohol dehydrogenase family)
VKLAGRVAVVTGAASGFGRATASRFASEGATVHLLDVSERGEEVAAELRQSGADAAFVRADVSDEASMEAALAGIVERAGRLDVMVNNAGVIGGGWIDEDDATVDLRRQLDVNVVGVWIGCRAAIRIMRTGRGGVILNTASAAALHPTPATPAYGLAKAAVVHLTRSLAIGYGPDGIRVNAVLPGPALTGIFDGTGATEADLVERYRPIVALRRLASTDDIAAAMLFLASDDAAFVTGAVFSVDGGMRPPAVSRSGR